MSHENPSPSSKGFSVCAIKVERQDGKEFYWGIILQTGERRVFSTRCLILLNFRTEIKDVKFSLETETFSLF